MIRIVHADERHYADHGWLQTYWLFSFADYFDPDNVQFGKLRVFNDDVIQPGTGFPMHSHREMEIVTIVLSGELTHGDSMGHETTIGAGEVQRMSAGTGLKHSEINVGTEPVHLYQIWILPTVHGVTPSYDQRRFDFAAVRNTAVPVASGQQRDGALEMNADATIYVAHLDAGNEIDFDLRPDRHLFAYLTEGAVSIDGTDVADQEQARISRQENCVIRAATDASLILVDVPPA